MTRQSRDRATLRDRSGCGAKQLGRHRICPSLADVFEKLDFLLLVTDDRPEEERARHFGRNANLARRAEYRDRPERRWPPALTRVPQARFIKPNSVIATGLEYETATLLVLKAQKAQHASRGLQAMDTCRPSNCEHGGSRRLTSPNVWPTESEGPRRTGG